VVSGFVVIRHSEAGVGTCHVDSLDIHRRAGWFRVSEPQAEPLDIRLSDYADAPDLDAEPAVDPDPAPAASAKASKETKAS
jgi:hypothetical protein